MYAWTCNCSNNFIPSFMFSRLFFISTRKYLSIPSFVSAALERSVTFVFFLTWSMPSAFTVYAVWPMSHLTNYAGVRISITWYSSLNVASKCFLRYLICCFSCCMPFCIAILFFTTVNAFCLASSLAEAWSNKRSKSLSLRVMNVSLCLLSRFFCSFSQSLDETT